MKAGSRSRSVAAAVLAIGAARETWWVLGLYLLLSAPALVARHRPAAWPALVAAHLAGAAVLLVGRLRGAVGQAGARVWPAGWAVARAWAPVVAVPLIYAEVPGLGRALYGETYFDGHLIAWERALFGELPSQTWATHVPVRAVSEVLHGAYLSYFLLIAGPPLALYVMRRRRAFETAVFLFVLVVVPLSLAFVYFPVQGPRYLFAAPTAGGIDAGPLYQLTHRVLEAGSSRGAAFPSGHVAIATVQTSVCARFLPRAFPLVAVLTALLAIATVYGGFHYLLDALTGLALGLLVATLGPACVRRR